MNALIKAIRDKRGENEIPDVYADVKMNGRMIQAMREVGFTPVMELDVLVDKGIAASYIYMCVLHVVFSPPPHIFFLDSLSALIANDDSAMERE